MKFEDKIFKPFKIVVETQEEANFLFALVAGTNSGIDDALGFQSWELHDYLASKAESHVAGIVDVTLNTQNENE